MTKYNYTIYYDNPNLETQLKGSDELGPWIDKLEATGNKFLVIPTPSKRTIINMDHVVLIEETEVEEGDESNV